MDKQTARVQFNENQEHYGIAGGNYTIVLDGSQTSGAYAVIDMLVPPGGGPGPHAHKDIQESFFVLEGEVVFSSDAGEIRAGKGSTVLIPQGGAVHAFRNESGQPARLLCTVAPAGLEAFFREIGEPVGHNVFPPRKPMTPEALEHIRTLGEQYGQTFFPPDYFKSK